MLLFYCADHVDLTVIRREGVHDADGVLLEPSLEAAQAACTGRILVIDADALPDVVLDEPAEVSASPVRASRVPPEAVCNLDPYLPPKPVAAAGGYVVRPGAGEPDVLLIFRRGAWDLPKGKRDPGETLEACALREVREEIGVKTLHLGQALGTTVHGYERGGAYHVKTTYWYLMRTPETRFTPEAREGIEEVAWMPWSKALRHLRYPSFRRHMRQVEMVVYDTLRDVSNDE